MDHYAPTHDLTQPWRTRTIVVSAIAAVELVALVAVGVVLLGKGWFQTERASAVRSATHHHTAAAHPRRRRRRPPSRTRLRPRSPLLPRAHTSVLVLNGNGQSGAAGAEAPSSARTATRSRPSRTRSAATTRPAWSCTDPATTREARRLARDLHIPGRVRPRRRAARASSTAPGSLVIVGK